MLLKSKFTEVKVLAEETYPAADSYNKTT
jgi:hypothetical protein